MGPDRGRQEGGQGRHRGDRQTDKQTGEKRATLHGQINFEFFFFGRRKQLNGSGGEVLGMVGKKYLQFSAHSNLA